MVEFANILFRGLTLKDIFSEHKGLKHIVTINAEYIVRVNENEKLRRIVNESIATFDGQVPYIVARWKTKNIKFEKISGSELIYYICERATQRKEKVFLLGGKEDSNFKSVEKLRGRYPSLIIDGFSPPFAKYPFPQKNNETIIDRLVAFKPQYLLVGFDALKQTYWIDDNRSVLEHMGVLLAVGVGGTFEMVAGKLKRAPKFIQRIGLEGVYRLLKEPKYFRFKRLILSLKFLRYV